MDENLPGRDAEAIEKRAARAKTIIYVCMAVFMILPVVLAWMTGALRF